MITSSEVGRMHTPISRQELTGSPSGPVITYTLSPEELEHYRNLPKYEPTKNIVTVAPRLRPKGVRNK